MASVLPTVHIICGPLGIGKTTTLRHLLRHKPAAERWAVLVNEWGEVGIDAATLPGSETSDIREIAGGCICCSSGPQLRLALDRLLASAPQRILIEPSGLAAPARLVDLLRQEPLGSRLRLGAIITLVDAAVFVSGAWRDDPAQADQIRVADILVANRNDNNDATLREAFSTATAALYPPPLASACIEYGALPLRWLELEPAQERCSTASQAGATAAWPLHLPRRQEDAATPPALQRRASRSGSVSACGWITTPDQIFTLGEVRQAFAQLPTWAEQCGGRLLRAKGVFRCGGSWWLFNWADGELQQEVVAWRRDSRWEILLDGGAADWNAPERWLLGRPSPTGEQVASDSQ